MLGSMGIPPVLLAHGYVSDLLGEFGVPQIWVVDPKGKWLWQQSGLPHRGRSGADEDFFQPLQSDPRYLDLLRRMD